MIKFEHTKHKALWNAIIDLLRDPNENIFSVHDLKIKAFYRLFPDKNPPIAICYACQYDEDSIEGLTEDNIPDCCVNCPLSWPNSKECDDDDSLFDRFENFCCSNNRITAIELAKQIRDCPVKDGIKTV